MITLLEYGLNEREFRSLLTTSASFFSTSSTLRLRRGKIHVQMVSLMGIFVGSSPTLMLYVPRFASSSVTTLRVRSSRTTWSLAGCSAVLRKSTTLLSGTDDSL